ncbi:MAG TPA: DUF4019 domain-containing protein [Woeseiaceae bacterium]|nr:DUF4019 domain-containing protein [Woeseiaceae bacterium]
MNGQLCAAMLALAFGSTLVESDIAVKRLASDRFELTLTTTTVLDVGLAQAMLTPTAESLCPNQQAEFGRYRFTTRDNVGQDADPNAQNSFELIQEVSCVDEITVPDNDTPSPASTDSADYQRLKQHIHSMTRRYFDAVYSGEYGKAYDFMSPEMQSFRGYEEWAAQMDTFRDEAGPVVTINIHKITVYDNPANAPTPGLYIAADYQNSLRNAPYHCGYLMWFRAGDSGEFQIIREESGVLTDKNLNQIPEKDHEHVLAELRCNAP